MRRLWLRAMRHLLSLFALILALALPGSALADPADVTAAARGVVRVVIVGREGEELFPVSHGTGFAVGPTTIVTNAHVVRDAVMDQELRIGIVPSGGGEAVYGQLIAISPEKDLALVRLTGDLRLPPLALAGGTPPDSGEVTSVGYPMNVDQAQGLEIADIFRSQPPVKSRGFISGTRPSRQFDTILHTAPIARGNSGGPLLDECGRVVGVNSFGADSGGADAEFFFAVSNRELAPFLEANGVDARINQQPCRSLADLDEAERERLELEQSATRAGLAERSDATRTQRERAQVEAQQAVLMEREDRIALAFVAVLLAIGLGIWSWRMRQAEEFDPRKANALAAGATVLGIVALALYLTRPGLDEIDRRVAEAMNPEASETDDDGRTDLAAESGGAKLQCTLVPERSRVTSAEIEDVEFGWTAAGCVNTRTQYGFAGGNWSRVFVPNDEEAVSVNSFDPERREFRTERYLLSREAMSEARTARAKYEAPTCGAKDAAARLGEMQAEVLGQLPPRPNERLVYECSAAR